MWTMPPRAGIAGYRFVKLPGAVNNGMFCLAPAWTAAHRW
jgi:hypothetical protein